MTTTPPKPMTAAEATNIRHEHEFALISELSKALLQEIDNLEGVEMPYPNAVALAKAASDLRKALADCEEHRRQLAG